MKTTSFQHQISHFYQELERKRERHLEGVLMYIKRCLAKFELQICQQGINQFFANFFGQMRKCTIT